MAMSQRGGRSRPRAPSRSPSRSLRSRCAWRASAARTGATGDPRNPASRERRMTVDELMPCIIAAYPGASLEATLGQAATEVLATFRPKYGQPFPIPADFEAVLPKQRRDIARAAPIDAGRHAERKRRLMAEWRRSVGAAVPEVKPPLETIAFRAADPAAWRATGKPIALSAKQQPLAQHRAVYPPPL